MITASETSRKSRCAGARGMSRALWAAMFALELCAQVPASAMAQRRRAEPEANPQFQQDVQNQSPSNSGQPVETPPAAQEGGRTQAPFPTRKVEGVQIGSVPTAPVAPPTPTNPLDTRITVRVKEAPLATFLDTISAQAKVNFIITEGLEQKRVTAFLQNVTVREALQTLLEIRGLTYSQVGRSSTYIVSPRAKGVTVRITRIYTLNYITMIPLNTTGAGGQSGSQGTSGASSVQAVASSEGGSTPGKGGSVKVPGGGDSGISILSIIASVLTTGGMVTIDPRTNSLIVTDIPEVFPQVEQIIAELDKKPPQVMIEAQIVEINSDRAQQLGLEWGGAQGQLATFSGPIRDTTFPLNLPNNLSHTHFFNPIANFASGAGNSSGLGASGGGGGGGGSGGTTINTGAAAAAQTIFGSTLHAGTLDLSSLTVILKALITKSEARFLGKPKILTLNNKRASIQIIRDQAVGVQNSQSATSGGLSSSVTAAERQQTGLKLDVTPQVNKEGYITLLVEPSFKNAVASSVGTNQLDPVERKASTLVRIRNGQTLVLGGLLSSTENKTVRKVPFLGYIPLIGWLFTSISNQRTNTDLVIFITPTVVND